MFTPEALGKFFNLDRKQLFEAFKSNKTITGFVTEINESEQVLMVNLGHKHIARLPFEEASIYPYTYNNRFSLPTQIYTLVNRNIQVKLTEFDPYNGRIFVSRKQNMEIALKYFSSLRKYTLVKGYVTHTTGVHAFIDIGAGIIGTVFIREASVFKISNITDVFQKNTETSIRILSKNENGYFSLSTKDYRKAELKKFIGQEMVATIDSPIPNSDICGYFVHVSPTLKGIVNVSKGIHLDPGTLVRVRVYNYSKRGLKFSLVEIL